MEIISLAPCSATGGASVALGMFDGVHMGHRRIIFAAKNKGTERGIPTSVLLFSSSPHAAPEILPLCDRLSELKKLGVNYAYVYNFDEIRTLSPEEFVKGELCGKLGAKAVFAGYNYRFGARAAGDSEMLKKLAAECAMECGITEKVEFLGDGVSSTRIRALLREGDIESANALLTYPYYVNSEVLHGKELGRKLGMPTVNQRIESSRTPLARGIYYTKTTVDGKEYISVSNLGVRPTVENTEEINLETHIIGFDGDLYGKTVKVSLYGKGRGEMCFDGVDELRREVERDIERAVNYFKK